MSGARNVLDLAHGKDLMVATAESCTGGMIAAALTDLAGSSAVFERGFVTYSNEAKHDMLGVPEAMIVQHGAVSAPVAEAMAVGALDRSAADVSVAVTGVAGPGGGSAVKPVGLVYIASARRWGETVVEEHRFADGANGVSDRAGIRVATVDAALALLIAQLTGAP